MRMFWDEPYYFSDNSRKHMTRWCTLFYENEWGEVDDILDFRLSDDNIVEEVCDYETMFDRKTLKGFIGLPMEEAQALALTILYVEGFKLEL